MCSENFDKYNCKKSQINSRSNDLIKINLTLQKCNDIKCENQVYHYTRNIIDIIRPFIIAQKNAEICIFNQSYDICKNKNKSINRDNSNKIHDKVSNNETQLLTVINDTNSKNEETDKIPKIKCFEENKDINAVTKSVTYNNEEDIKDIKIFNPNETNKSDKIEKNKISLETSENTISQNETLQNLSKIQSQVPETNILSAKSSINELIENYKLGKHEYKNLRKINNNGVKIIKNNNFDSLTNEELKIPKEKEIKNYVQNDLENENQIIDERQPYKPESINIIETECKNQDVLLIHQSLTQEDDMQNTHNNITIKRPIICDATKSFEVVDLFTNVLKVSTPQENIKNERFDNISIDNEKSCFSKRQDILKNEGIKNKCMEECLSQENTDLKIKNYEIINDASSHADGNIIRIKQKNLKINKEPVAKIKPQEESEVLISINEVKMLDKKIDTPISKPKLTCLSNSKITIPKRIQVSEFKKHDITKKTKD